jgi:hypothetical protein
MSNFFMMLAFASLIYAEFERKQEILPDPVVIRKLVS